MGRVMVSWQARSAQHRSHRKWVEAPGSLSAHLAACGDRFSVQVLRQGRACLRADEALALGCTRVQAGYVREVVLHVDAKPVVYARSVTLHAHAHGPWRALRGLGTRPLANVLFKQVTGISRSALSFAQLQAQSPLRQRVARAWPASDGPASPRAVPARRSVFRRKGAPLLVMEVFCAADAPWGWGVSEAARRSA